MLKSIATVLLALLVVSSISFAQVAKKAPLN